MQKGFKASVIKRIILLAACWADAGVKHHSIFKQKLFVREISKFQGMGSTIL